MKWPPHGLFLNLPLGTWENRTVRGVAQGVIGHPWQLSPPVSDTLCCLVLTWLLHICVSVLTWPLGWAGGVQMMQSPVGQTSCEGTEQGPSGLCFPPPLGGREDPRGRLAFTLGLQPFLTSGCLSVVQHMGGWRQCRKLFFRFPNKSRSPASGQTPGTCILGTEEPP